MLVTLRVESFWVLGVVGISSLFDLKRHAALRAKPFGDDAENVFVGRPESHAVEDEPFLTASATDAVSVRVVFESRLASTAPLIVGPRLRRHPLLVGRRPVFEGRRPSVNQEGGVFGGENPRLCRIVALRFLRFRGRFNSLRGGPFVVFVVARAVISKKFDRRASEDCPFCEVGSRLRSWNHRIPGLREFDS